MCVVCTQWANLLVCKTITLSLSQQGMVNQMANFGLAFETVLVITLTYIHGLNIGLGTRQLASPHFAIPGFMYFCTLFWVD